jgi:Ca-activated chloride channel family protein
MCPAQRARSSVTLSTLGIALIALAGALVAGCGGRSATHKAAVNHEGRPWRHAEATMKGIEPNGAPGEFADKKFNTEAYDRIFDNPYLKVAQHPLSTFSIDVDTASYSNVRRFLTQGQLPPKDAVRVEELVNYFTYDYPEPRGEHPIGVTTEVGPCPWNANHQLLRIGLRGKRIDAENLPPRNFVFLVDTSGSMNAENRLPLLQKSLGLLVPRFTRQDRVAIVAYAGSAGLVLPSTSGDRQNDIRAALNRLHAGGSTNGGEGIVLTYRIAEENFIQGGVNRVILGTDGDFNVGVTSQGDLVRLIEEKRKTGVYLSILGFGMGNLKDSTMEKLAHHGNGHYAYIDTIDEARRIFVEQGASLCTIANDVKVQVEFNPRRVQAYRLIGYENRLLLPEDFNDDTKDAGDMGAGHCVTALYQLVPPGQALDVPGVDPLRYQEPSKTAPAPDNGELLYVKIRYTPPEARHSVLLSHPVINPDAKLDARSADFRFASAVASFGMLLRESRYKGDTTYASVLRLARAGLGPDLQGHRAEFVRLVEAAHRLSRQ